MVRQYVTTIMTSGIKKATKEPISMKRSSLRTQVPLTKTLFSLWSPMTGIGIETPRDKDRVGDRKESVSVCVYFFVESVCSTFIVFSEHLLLIVNRMVNYIKYYSLNQQSTTLYLILTLQTFWHNKYEIMCWTQQSDDPTSTITQSKSNWDDLGWAGLESEATPLGNSLKIVRKLFRVTSSWGWEKAKSAFRGQADSLTYYNNTNVLLLRAESACWPGLCFKEKGRRRKAFSFTAPRLLVTGTFRQVRKSRSSVRSVVPTV